MSHLAKMGKSAIFTACLFLLFILLTEQAGAAQQTEIPEPMGWLTRNNWSGVEYLDYNHAFSYSDAEHEPYVSLSFVVPTITQDKSSRCTTREETGFPLQSMSIWVGFDGDPAVGRGELPQAGISAIYWCFPWDLVKAPEYYAWLEWFNGDPKQKETRLEVPVIPGHNMFILVRLKSPYTAAAIFNDFTAGTQTSYQFGSPDAMPVIGLTAECILERPRYYNQRTNQDFLSNLPHYGTLDAGCGGWTNGFYDVDGSGYLQYVPHGYTYLVPDTNSASGRWIGIDMREGRDIISTATPIQDNWGWLTWQFHARQFAPISSRATPSGLVSPIPHGLSGAH